MDEHQTKDDEMTERIRDLCYLVPLWEGMDWAARRQLAYALKETGSLLDLMARQEFQATPRFAALRQMHQRGEG